MHDMIRFTVRYLSLDSCVCNARINGMDKQRRGYRRFGGNIGEEKDVLHV